MAASRSGQITTLARVVTGDPAGVNRIRGSGPGVRTHRRNEIANAVSSLGELTASRSHLSSCQRGGGFKQSRACVSAQTGISGATPGRFRYQDSPLHNRRWARTQWGLCLTRRVEAPPRCLFFRVAWHGYQTAGCRKFGRGAVVRPVDPVRHGAARGSGDRRRRAAFAAKLGR